MKRILFLVIAGLFIISSAFGADSSLILDWNALMLDAIRLDDNGPTLSSRNLAILHGAIYDAINSVERSHQPYHYLVEAPSGTSEEAAALGAANEVVQTLYPSIQSRADTLYDFYLGSWPPTASVTNGLVLGQSVARQMLDWRSADGSSTSVPYIPSDAPGQWRRTSPFFRPPLDPQWRYVTPFCLPNIEPFVATSLPPLTSADYADAFNQVKFLGEKNSTTRTAEQSQMAAFWSDFSYTVTPAGHWNEVAASIARNQQTSFFDTARLFALINLAQADGAIVCWEAKYRFNSWRPVTAIQRADEDGNPATEKDINWVQNLPAPSFPEYPSGHSTFSAASAQVLTAFYGTDALSFTAASDALPGVFRSFTSLAACADEIGISRVYGGFHFQFSIRDGKASGKKVGDYVARNFLLPNEALPRVDLEGIDPQQLRLRVQGRIGTSCLLEASVDLRHWLPISTNAAVIGGVLVTDGAPRTHRFYRVR